MNSKKMPAPRRAGTGRSDLEQQATNELMRVQQSDPVRFALLWHRISKRGVRPTSEKK